VIATDGAAITASFIQLRNGSLELQNSSLFGPKDFTIGEGIGNTGDFRVSGDSGIVSLNTIVVGASGGTGNVLIEHGASFTSFGYAIIGVHNGTGTVTVNGMNSAWLVPGTTYGALEVGGAVFGWRGQGTLNILDNGSVFAERTVNIFADGQVNLDGGTLQTGMLNLVEPGAEFNFLNGTLNAQSVFGELIQNGGETVIGNSPGLMTVNGDYIQNGGAIEFELAGLIRGTQFDALDISGLADFNGIMDINLISGFIPSAGDTFELANFGSFTGNPTFDFADADLSASHLFWNTRLFSTQGIIFVSAVPEPSSFAAVFLVAGTLIMRRRHRTRAAG
jgi:T5SS/PEP-CTERM-associated repeat protein